MDIKVRSFYDICCDKCGRWRSTDYNKGMHFSKVKIKEEARKEGWKVKNTKTICPSCANNTNKITLCRCPKCGNVLDKSDLPDYEYVCYNCDENFYSFEVIN